MLSVFYKIGFFYFNWIILNDSGGIQKDDKLGEWKGPGTKWFIKSKDGVCEKIGCLDGVEALLLLLLLLFSIKFLKEGWFVTKWSVKDVSALFDWLVADWYD